MRIFSFYSAMFLFMEWARKSKIVTCVTRTIASITNFSLSILGGVFKSAKESIGTGGRPKPFAEEPDGW